jgi:putative lipoic acid-binding regulatory protein
MNDVEPPRIEFPCAYPIKVMGTAGEDFEAFVLEVLGRHAELAVGERVEVVASRTGRFLSVRVTIMATGEPQLRALHEELKASGRVHMVL